MNNKISVIIITGNEALNIRDCLESVKWADEIVVVDSESKDGTVDIVKNYTEKVFIKPWNGYSEQWKYALSKAGNEWVLVIAADERVTSELEDEIKNKDLSIADGFFVRRKNYFLGKLINSCGWEKDYQLRLFRKSRTSVTDDLVHEGFEVTGKREHLSNSLLHFTNRSLHHAIDKANEYSSLGAIGNIKKTKKYSFIKLIIKPPVSFYHYYFARKGFKDGVHGFLVSLLHSISSLMLTSKLWELNRNKSG